MKKAVWVGLALFLLALIGVPNARADSYKPAFTHSEGSSHNSAAIRHFSFDETGEASREGAHRFGRASHHGAVAGVDEGAGDNDGDHDTAAAGSSDSGTGMGSSGSSVPTATTPEPTTLILMLLGIGLLFVTRKRFIPSVPRNP